MPFESGSEPEDQLSVAWMDAVIFYSACILSTISIQRSCLSGGQNQMEKVVGQVILTVSASTLISKLISHSS
jgi:hypothetical protein